MPRADSGPRAIRLLKCITPKVQLFMHENGVIEKQWHFISLNWNYL